jgi:hypothetical protein
MFKYVIKADNYKCLVVHSDLNFFEFKSYIQGHCVKSKKNEDIAVFKYGLNEFVNPVVMMVEDYANYLPVLMEIN